MCAREGWQGLLWSLQRFYLPLFTLAKVLSGVLVWLEGCNTLQWEIHWKGCATRAAFGPVLLTKTIYANAFPDKFCRLEQAALLSWQMFCCINRNLVNKRWWWLSAVSVRCGKSGISLKAPGFTWLELAWHRPSDSLYPAVDRKIIK